MVKRVEYITPAVQEKISTAHLVLVSARQTIPRNDDEIMKIKHASLIILPAE